MTGMAAPALMRTGSRRPTLRNRGRREKEASHIELLLTVGNLGFIQKELRAMQGPRNCYDLRFPWS